ncbi:unnamed protein product, partial [marine sediment metagenome]
IDIWPEFQTMIGTMDDIYDNIQNRQPIFNVIQLDRRQPSRVTQTILTLDF